MKEITSINNDYIKYLLKLKDKKTRIEEKKYLIEGYHLVEEAYNAKVLEEILYIEDFNNFNNISKIKVTESIIKKLSSTVNPQGIIGVCKINNDNIIKGNKILLLDNINDPGNLGTLIRSSLGFEIDTIVMSHDCVDLYNEKVIRATQGAIFKINIVIEDLNESIKFLKTRDVKIIGTALDSAKYLQEIKGINKYAILLGNEARGVKRELLDQTDINVKIEMNNQLESLNVAVAGSILMYYLNN